MDSRSIDVSKEVNSSLWFKKQESKKASRQLCTGGFGYVVPVFILFSPQTHNERIEKTFTAFPTRGPT
jgi:hypothetical protein